MEVILSSLVSIALQLYSYLVLARILMSWVNPDPHHPAVQWIHRLTEPVLAPARRFVPSVGGIDFSPILVFFVLDFVSRQVVMMLWRLGL